MSVANPYLHFWIKKIHNRVNSLISELHLFLQCHTVLLGFLDIEHFMKTLNRSLDLRLFDASEKFQKSFPLNGGLHSVEKSHKKTDPRKSSTWMPQEVRINGQDQWGNNLVMNGAYWVYNPLNY